MPRADEYLRAVRRLRFEGNTASIHEVALATNVNYDTARQGLRRAGVRVRTQEETLLLGYRSAALLAQAAHPQRIATFEGVARVRGVTVESVYKFFSDPKRAEYRIAWGIVYERDVTKVLLRRAALRWKKTHPGKVLTRKILAYESKLSYSRIAACLNAHPDFCQEIGVAYTYSGYAHMGRAHMKQVAALWRDRHPGEALTRVKFAKALKWSYSRLASRLLRHPELIEELGITGRAPNKWKRSSHAS